MNSWLWAALAAVGGAALWYIMTMNRFARLLVKIRESDSGIEVALTRRFDTLTRMLDANSQMDVLHGKINVLAEAYPELRSSENFRVLQASIAEIEEELQAVRRIYNMNVSQFNQMLAAWPDSIVGRLHGHKKEDFFKAKEEKKQDVAMQFSL